MMSLFADLDLIQQVKIWTATRDPATANTILEMTPRSAEGVCAYLMVMHQATAPETFDLDDFVKRFHRAVAGAQSALA
jgi:hypothetical protein